MFKVKLEVKAVPERLQVLNTDFELVGTFASKTLDAWKSKNKDSA